MLAHSLHRAQAFTLRNILVKIQEFFVEYSHLDSMGGVILKGVQGLK